MGNLTVSIIGLCVQRLCKRLPILFAFIRRQESLIRRPLLSGPKIYETWLLRTRFSLFSRPILYSYLLTQFTFLASQKYQAPKGLTSNSDEITFLQANRHCLQMIGGTNLEQRVINQDFGRICVKILSSWLLGKHSRTKLPSIVEQFAVSLR